MARPSALLEIEVVGLRDLQGRFAAATRELQTRRREELKGLGARVVDAIAAEVPVRTGRLQRGIGYRVRRDGKVMELAVTSEAPYTIIVLRGRGPVVARRAKALRFEPGPPGSGFIFRKRVGPAAANPFMARALRRLSAAGEPYKTAASIGRHVQRVFERR